jgi:SAM-dependent methyltransferase
MSEIKYQHDVEVHNTKDAKAFIPILSKYIQPSSVLDVGCGIGTWLRVFQDKGIDDVVGVDGSNVEKSLLAIPIDHFIEHNLTKPLNLNRKFDLVICLEVAEHLPAEFADNIIDILTTHSDNILFSAALPMQGGQNHLNEQPFMYWVEKFNAQGYVVEDVFRNLIWENAEIKWWYRQNMFLVSKKESFEQKKIYDYYHPEAYIGISEYNEYYHNRLHNIQNGKVPFVFPLKTLIKSVAAQFKEGS